MNTLLTQLLQWAVSIKNQTQPLANTHTIVGGLLEQIVIYLESLLNKIVNIPISLIFQNPVPTFNALATTYPNAVIGWASLVEDVGFIYQFDGMKWNNTGLTAFPSDIVTTEDLLSVVFKETVLVNPFMIQQLGLWKPHTAEEIYVDLSKIIKSVAINITSNFRKTDGNIRRIKIRSEQYTPSTSTASIALDVESVDGIFVNAGIKNTTNGFVTFDLDFGSIDIELNIDRMSVIVPNTPTTYQQGGISEKLIENAIINFESKRKRIYKNVNWVGMSIWWYDGEVLAGTSEIARGYQTLLKEQFWFKSDTGTNYCYSGNSLGGLTVGDTSSIMNHSSSWTGTLGDIWTLDSITNDFKRNIPIGTINDYNNATGITTFYGALRAYKNKVISLSGSTAIVICANSLRRNNSGYTSTSTNTVGATLVDYEKAMMTVASLNKWSFVDQFRMSGITDDSIFITTLDGLHLNNFGYPLAVLPWISIFDSLYNKSKA